MALPTFSYTKVNGVRKVSINGGTPLPTNNLVVPAGTHDIKDVNGISLIRKGNDLHEPLDIATALGKF